MTDKQSRIRVCCVCGEIFYDYAHEDYDKCPDCRGLSRLALTIRSEGMRKQLKDERERRWGNKRGDDDE